MRQLLIHRHKLVEIRTRVKNAWQHLALNKGLQKKNAPLHPSDEDLSQGTPAVGGSGEG